METRTLSMAIASFSRLQTPMEMTSNMSRKCWNVLFDPPEWVPETCVMIQARFLELGVIVEDVITDHMENPKKITQPSAGVWVSAG